MRIKRSIKLLLLVSSCFFCLVLFHSILPEVVFSAQSSIYLSEESMENESGKLPTGRLTFGTRFSGPVKDGTGDLLLPIFGDDSGFIFLDFRLHVAEHSENEQNAGIGLRKMLFDDTVLGGFNAFYDHRELSSGNDFHQFGSGLELITEIIEVRFNYYWPFNSGKKKDDFRTVETSRSSTSSTSAPFTVGSTIKRTISTTTTTTRTIREFKVEEEALDGFDIEAGILLPLISDVMETRLYAGYFDFHGEISRDINGGKIRLEARPWDNIIFDAQWLGDDNLHGSEYFVGFRFHVPFDGKEWFQEKNWLAKLFAKKSKPVRSLKERMTEMVMRDPLVVTGQGRIKKTDEFTTVVVDESSTDQNVGTVPPPPPPPPPPQEENGR